MTKGGSFKRAVRQRARASGERYTQARTAAGPRPTRKKTDAPIPVLLAHLLLDLNRDVDRAAVPLVLWANLLRAIADDGISLTDLAPAARVSRRALKASLGIEKLGWLEITTPEPRVTIVKLTETGRRTRDVWDDLIATTEA